MTIRTFIKRLYCFIDVLDTTFRKVNCVVRLEVDIVKHSIFFPTDTAIELLCAVSIFARCIPIPFAFPNPSLLVDISSNQEALKTFGYSEGHTRWF